MSEVMVGTPQVRPEIQILDVRLVAIEKKLDKMEAENRDSHRATSESLARLTLLLGEHGLVIKHHEQRIGGIEHKARELDEGLGDMGEVTGRHQALIVEREKVLEQRGYWLRQAAKAAVTAVVGAAALWLLQRLGWFR